MYKLDMNIQKRGEMQEDGKMGVMETFYITVENEKGNILFSWVEHSQKAAESTMKQFKDVQNDKEALKALIAELKSHL